MPKFPVSGKEMPEIDLREVNVSEWRAMFDQTQPDHEGDATMAKATGMSLEEIQSLKLYDYRALFQAILDKSRRPLDDPKN